MTLLDAILARAVELEASDLHLKEGARPVFRIRGKLVPAEDPRLRPSDVAEMALQFLPHLAAGDLPGLREADASYQSGEFGRFRINAYRQRGMLALSVRRVKTAIPSFADLSLPVATMENIGGLNRGLVLICGTTGAGKTTTLASLLQHLNQTTARHIVTVEDPIEYLLRDDRCVIEQREIGIDTRDFGTALRQVLRQDPDVIVVGEMRDTESFRAGLSAAETGHLVLATMHAENARQAIERVLDFFPAQERHQVRRQLGLALRALVSQRLVPSREGGRLPALEILRTSDTVRQLFEKDELHLLKTAILQGENEGMQTFDQALLALAAARRITDETALHYAESPEALRMNLRGIFTSETRLLR